MPLISANPTNQRVPDQVIREAVRLGTVTCAQKLPMDLGKNALPNKLYNAELCSKVEEFFALCVIAGPIPPINGDSLHTNLERAIR